MDYEYIKLESIIQSIDPIQIKRSYDEVLEIQESLLTEKHQILRHFEMHLKNVDNDKVLFYFKYHYIRLTELIKDAENYHSQLKYTIIFCLSDLKNFLNMNVASVQDSQEEIFTDKCFVPFSVEVVALLCRLLWDEGFIKMRFKSHFIRSICKKVTTLRAGVYANISEKHFQSSMTETHKSTLVTVERLLNRLKLRLNKIRKENIQI